MIVLIVNIVLGIVLLALVGTAIWAFSTSTVSDDCPSGTSCKKCSCLSGKSCQTNPVGGGGEEGGEAEEAEEGGTVEEYELKPGLLVKQASGIAPYTGFQFWPSIYFQEIPNVDTVNIQTSDTLPRNSVTFLFEGKITLNTGYNLYSLDVTGGYGWLILTFPKKEFNDVFLFSWETGREQPLGKLQTSLGAPAVVADIKVIFDSVYNNSSCVLYNKVSESSTRSIVSKTSFNHEVRVAGSD